MARKRKGNYRRKNKSAKRERSQKRDDLPVERNPPPDFAYKSSVRRNDRRLISPRKEDVEKLLDGIGIPEPGPFIPDEFQTEALDAIETQDVLVTAPTGSGKTWIAREEIRRLLTARKRAWYTTPLKALTNSKYSEFGEEFGAENVGILTGDRKENPRAPLIVGTTEIYRNQLFDSLRSGEQVSTDFVILDEAHYLSDDYRGHVWEEAIILSPPRIRMLLLSATIGNAKEFAKWIGDVRGTNVKIIKRAGSRPVELRAAFLAPNTELFPLYDNNGKFNGDIRQFGRKDNDRGNRYRRRR
jgi:superfamily II RNA helicase